MAVLPTPTIPHKQISLPPISLSTSPTVHSVRFRCSVQPLVRRPPPRYSWRGRCAIVVIHDITTSAAAVHLFDPKNGGRSLRLLAAVRSATGDIPEQCLIPRHSSQGENRLLARSERCIMLTTTFHQTWGIKYNFSQPFYIHWDTLLQTRYRGGAPSKKEKVA